MPEPPADFASRPARPPWRVLATLAGAAVLLHALLIAGVTSAEPTAGRAPQAAAMLVRTLPTEPAEPTAPEAAPAVTDAAVVAAAPAETATPAAASVSKRRAQRFDAADAPAAAAATVVAGAEADAPAAPASGASAASAAPADVAVALAAPPASSPPPVAQDRPAADDGPSAEPARPASRTAGPAAVTLAASAHGAGAPDADPPGSEAAPRHDELAIYKTVFPPPLTLHYDLRRGLLSGSGTLAWRPEADHYELRLEGRVAGLNVLTQVSQGGFDDAGLAPRRYTDQRLNRASLAANFNREQGRITFSGPSTEFPLLVGTQDRLSWMIQLAAIVSAEPRRAAAGGKVAIYVVGARADASMWVFRCAGIETVETPGGAVQAARFTREPRSAHDTLAEAWLDPARHGLPVRARVGTGDGGDAVELSLRELHLP